MVDSPIRQEAPSLATRAEWGADSVTLGYDLPWRPSYAVWVLAALVLGSCSGAWFLAAAVVAAGAVVWWFQLDLPIARERVRMRIDARCAWVDGSQGRLGVWRLQELELRERGRTLDLYEGDKRLDRLDLRFLSEEDRRWLVDLLKVAVERARSGGAATEDPEAIAKLRSLMKRG